MKWPEGQVLPQFASVSDTLDAVFTDRPPLSMSEDLMLVTLQGVVNRTKPRVILLTTGRGGEKEWAEKLSLNCRVHPSSDIYGLVKKYSKEFDGVVLYDVSKSVHYVNLASTVAGIRNALAMTENEYERAKTEGVSLEVLEDLSGLPYTDAVGIYDYMYETYWEECTRRILLSLNPGVVTDIRDMAIATGAAAIWLDPRKKEEKAIAEKFLADMTAGESIILGWWPEERSGIGLGTSFGIPTIPSDFYDNSTVYAGESHVIQHAPVPKKPVLDNKIYVALFLSDGDNAQYCEHTMPRLWSNENRGVIPVNWTASPALVDLDPGLLNYYYRTATDNDCICSGPSGLGYALIYDAFHDKLMTTEREKIDPYTKMTQQYLEKSGMRTITIWDEIDGAQMNAYEENCRFLYGLTQQDWKRKYLVETHHVGGRLAILPNRPCYAGNVDDIYEHWKDTISSYSGKQPIFLSAQGVSWNLGPQEIVKLYEKLSLLAPERSEICRADHFFALYNEAAGLDFNLTLLPEVTVSTSSSNEDAGKISDGSSSLEYQWISDTKGKQEIVFDFNRMYTISRYVIRHAGYAGAFKSYNTRRFHVELSEDGKVWTLADVQKNNRDDVSDIDISPRNARYLRIIIENPGKSGFATIGDVEIYGSLLN